MKQNKNFSRSNKEATLCASYSNILVKGGRDIRYKKKSMDHRMKV